MADTGAWGTSSGLLDDYEHHWEEVWFGYNDKYQDGKTLLLHVQGPAYQENEDGDMEVVDEEQLTMYSCGDGWDAAKGGEEAAHANGNPKFSGNSNAGKLVNRVMDLLGEDGLPDLAEKGNPTQAKTWRGMVVHIERQEFPFTDRKTGEKSSYEVALPTEIIELGEPEDDAPRGRAKSKTAAKGKGSAASSRGKATAAKSRSRAKAKADDDDDDDEAEIEEAEKEKASGSKPARKPRASRAKKKDLRTEVVEFAAGYDEDDHGSFLDAVYDSGEFPRADEIDEDEDLTDEILDPDSDLWAEAHA